MSEKHVYRYACDYTYQIIKQMAADIEISKHSGVWLQDIEKFSQSLPKHDSVISRDLSPSLKSIFFKYEEHVLAFRIKFGLEVIEGQWIL